MIRKQYSQALVALCVIATSSYAFAADWKQRGGPGQSYKVKSEGLATEWPAEGPPELWSRDLGPGYSGIVVKGDRLYTMYRDGEQEAVVCLNAKDGEVVWEHKYDAPMLEKHTKQFGSGPRGTPLLSGKRLFTIGCTGKMFCLSAKSGKVRWSKDLWKDYGGTFLNHGYSSSPISYKKTVIVMVGGAGHSFVAFNKKSGEEVWKRQSFDNSYSTPKMIKVGDNRQLVCFMATELVSIDPANGKLAWKVPHENQWKQNICMPILCDDNVLFMSANRAGSKGLQLTPKGKKTRVKEIWANDKFGIHHSNAIRVGDYVYTVTGGRGPGLFQAINAKTGEVALKERGFAKANLLHADGMFIILDENGTLAIATATPELLEVHARAEVLRPSGAEKVWACPTLVDKTLFLRDANRILALDLGEPSERVGLLPKDAAPDERP